MKKLTPLILFFVFFNTVQASLLNSLLQNKVKNEIDTQGELKTPVYLINSMEFKFGVEEELEEIDDGISDSSRNFSLRFQPKNSGEYTENFNLFKTQKKILEHYVHSTKSEQKKDIYIIYLDYVYSLFQLEAKKNQLQLVKDKLVVLKKQGAAINYDQVFEYQGKTITHTKDFLRSQRQVKRREIFLKEIFNLETNSFKNVQKQRLISLKKIERIVKKLQKQKSPITNEIELKKLELKHEKLKFKIEKKTRDTYLRYIEVKYDQKDSDDRQVGFAVSFDLPFTRDNSVNYNQRYISAIKAQKDLGRLEDRWQLYSRSKTQRLLELIEDIKGTNNATEYKNLRNYLKHYAKRKNSSVLRLLSLKERISKIESEKLENTFEALKAYIEVIYDYRHVAMNVDINFLSPKLEEAIFE